MKQKDLLKLLDNMEEQGEETVEGERILMIDGLNLFFRNFAMMNMVNPEGIHVGGLGGFFRSLGAEIRRVDPTQVYVIFDGAGSSNNRKNLLPEYKSGRNLQRITNWEAFDNLEDEHDAKVDQIVRIIQYLKTLPVKTIGIPKVEADDVIAYLSNAIPSSPKDKVFIVSSDKDFLQLINENVIVYRPMEKEFYTEETVIEKFKMTPHNFILYKTLMGDNSDKVAGIKGLGEKKLYKLFPELSERDLTLDDIYNICEEKFKENVIYARIIQNFSSIETNYKIMDLSNPMIDKNDENYLNKIIESKELNYMPNQFIAMYNEDKLGGMIRNLEFWIKDVFDKLSYNK
jgi:DNA polymerase I|tara:strand:- start:1122 stop:2153 length:1032 start_codon:yes stop_codon:yes gene_type:complete